MRRRSNSAAGGAWRTMLGTLGTLTLSGTLVLTLATAVMPLAAQSGSASGATVSMEDAAAIKEVVAKYVAAREQNDVAAVTALFTPDADQLVSSGEWRRGRAALVTGAMASSQRSSGKRTVTVETIRVIAPGVALADGRYEIAASSGNAARLMWSSFVLVRTADGAADEAAQAGAAAGREKGTEGGSAGRWRIAAIRNMLPAPPPPAAAVGR